MTASALPAPSPLPGAGPAPAGGWTVEALPGWRAPAALEPAWASLASRTGDDGVFLSPEWYSAWGESFGAGSGAFLLALSRDGRLRALVPLRRAASGAVSSLTNDHSPAYRFPLDPEGADETIEAFADWAARAGCRLEFADLPADAPEAGRLEAALLRRGFRVQAFDRACAPAVDLTRGREAYFDGLHSKLKNNLKKGRRRAEKEGALRLDAVSGPDALDAVLDEAFRVEASGWKGSRGTAIGADPAAASFYRRLAAAASRRGAFRLYALRLGGRMIAFDFCLASGRTLFALKTGYDESLSARFSAGNLMRAELLRRLFAEREFDRYDLLGEAFPWKLEWNAACQARRSLWCYPPTWRGRLGFLLRHGWRNAVKRLLSRTSAGGAA